MARITMSKPKAAKARNPVKSRPPAQPTRSRSKAGAIVALLKSKRGATIPDLMKTTGWQAHSVRGFLAGSLRKRHGQEVVSEKREGKLRRYRLR